MPVIAGGEHIATNVGVTLFENNDEEVNLFVTTNVPMVNTPLDLTGMSIEVYLKTSNIMTDTDPSTWKGATGTGEVVTTNASQGAASVFIPASVVTTGKAWWRVDVLNAALKRKTAIYGMVTVVDT